MSGNPPPSGPPRHGPPAPPSGQLGRSRGRAGAPPGGPPPPSGSGPPPSGGPPVGGPPVGRGPPIGRGPVGRGPVQTGGRPGPPGPPPPQQQQPPTPGVQRRGIPVGSQPQGPPPPGPPRAIPLPQGAVGGRAIFRSDHRGEISSRDMATLSISGASGGADPAPSGDGSTSAGGSGGAQSTIGRGATRGSREKRRFIVETRPTHIESKKGTCGDAINLVANFFKIVKKPDWTLQLYRVDFSPDDEDRTFVKKRLLRQHAAGTQLGQVYLFDGSMLFTPQRYNPDPFTINAKDENGRLIVITIKNVGECKPTDFTYVQFFNIVLRRCMDQLNLDLVGRNFYDSKAKKSLHQWKLEIWPGYDTSIRQHEQELLLCCELSNKVLRTDSVLDQLRAIYKQAGGGNFQNAATRLLVGHIVITTYNNKTYHIDDIDFNINPMSTFAKKDGSRCSYAQYYKERYNRVITDVKQPMLISQPKLEDRRRGFDHPIILVPELCNMTGLSDEQRANFQLMKDMGEYTRLIPPNRVEALRKFSNRLATKPEVQQELKTWGLGLSNDLTQLKGRLLKPEEILVGNNKKQIYRVDNAEWNGAFREKLFNMTTCDRWAIVFPEREQNEAREFVQALSKVSPGLGFRLASPVVFPIKDNRSGTYVEKLKQIAAQKPHMIMAVVPNNKNADTYNAIKKQLCLQTPIPSQVVTGTVLKKPKGLMSVATKVAVQMAAKLGSEPWAVIIPIKDMMIIGYDSYHDSSQKGRSVGAVVATLNQTMTRFTSSCSLHNNNEELLNQMKSCIGKALRKYQEVNGSFPKRIVIYRDGVGDGQIEYVRMHEIKIIQSLFCENKIDPMFTYIIVSKRINTKLFKQMGNNFANPPSGTVVDDVITLPERYDFFLVSQSVRQGTVNPTSYNIIEDTSGLKPDHLQQLTYKLCHLYFNWPGTVRVPAVCQYAHKLAYLVGQSLHAHPREELCDLLFYL